MSSHGPLPPLGSGQWPTWKQAQWPEPGDPTRLQVWVYPGQPSYASGEQASFHLSSSADEVWLTVARDGVHPQVLTRLGPIRGRLHEVPADVVSEGCRWPASFHLQIPPEWPSGGYLLIAEGRRGDQWVSQDGFFAIRAHPCVGARNPSIALIASTYTWNAYNDWGGASSYTSPHATPGLGFAPRLSLQRPWSRGQIRCPVGAPRFGSIRQPPIGWAVRHEWTEWAYANGYAHWSASAGWARYDGLMCRWLESQDIGFDLLTQWDLDRDPSILQGYACVITCGHDEYWSAMGRGVLAEFIADGGNHARFGGNIMWQVRADPKAQTTECYKFCDDADPERDGPRDSRTGAFEGLAINRPPVTEFGGNATRGMYAGWGGASIRGVRGFIVYRPRHWAFDGIDAYYGDVIGAATNLVSYEADGVDYTMVNGLPVPTGSDGTPPDLQILALAPTTAEEEDHGNPGSVFDPVDHDLAGIAKARYGTDTPEHRDLCRYGAAMITSMSTQGGAVFCAGSTEWPASLDQGDRACERITRNVLTRFTDPVAR
jgi:hypothetical protein